VTVEIKRDATAPDITHDVAGSEGANGWYVSPVTATFTASDATSGLAGSGNAEVSSAAEGEDVAINSPQFADNAGNTSSVTAGPFKIDLTDPTAAFDSTLDGSYYYGQVPNKPTCTASDAISGAAGCTVTGYSDAVGTHTLTATATDNAGRTSTATQTYNVLAWTLKGFYQPVDMHALNTVKSGSTVPLKFEVAAGADEFTDVAAIKTFKVGAISCETFAGDLVDDIEQYTSGATVLRYDASGGQFIQNWQTPKGKAGTCYRTTLTTQDGSSISANFKLK
jgi:hypothetical protein